MFDDHIKDLMNEILVIQDDDVLLIQYLNAEEIEDHHEWKNLKLVHFELMVKLFLYVEYDVDHISPKKRYNY